MSSAFESLTLISERRSPPPGPRLRVRGIRATGVPIGTRGRRQLSARHLPAPALGPRLRSRERRRARAAPAHPPAVTLPGPALPRHGGRTGRVRGVPIPRRRRANRGHRDRPARGAPRAGRARAGRGRRGSRRTGRRDCGQPALATMASRHSPRRPVGTARPEARRPGAAAPMPAGPAARTDGSARSPGGDGRGRRGPSGSLRPHGLPRAAERHPRRAGGYPAGLTGTRRGSGFLGLGTRTRSTP